MTVALDRGRSSFKRNEWADAYQQLSAAQDEAPLELDDLERLAIAAHLTGQDEESADVWARAHHECVRQGAAARGARCAFWLGLGLILRGETSRGGGWLARAQQVVDEGDLDCAERGYLLIPTGLVRLESGDSAGALDAFVRASALGERFRDADLIALSRLGRGQALLERGETAKALALLDEAIVALTTGEMSPMVVGLVYCGAIEACQETFDLVRAREWTAALSHWCDAQPDLVPYRGQCLVHRAEIMQLHGAWADADDEAQRACERLSGEPGVGAAFYQQAELHRLRGNLRKAEEAYRLAHQWGREPQPGLSLLRLAQGQHDTAQAAIRRILSETESRVARSRLLGAYVEIMLAAGDVTSARRGADELDAIAAALDVSFLRAAAAQAGATVLLADDDAQAALPLLRKAWSVWRDLDAPYQAARTRVLIARACRAMGDEETAEMELDAARLGFGQLGAATDLAYVETLTRAVVPKSEGGLTAREVEVLTLVATGRTNREISAQLVISEHTVARHLQNIFAKLGVSSRTAASAYAFDRGLV